MSSEVREGVDPSGARGPNRTPTSRDRIGERVKDRYVLSAEIGKGGMAVVYRARDIANDRDVALKKLLAGDDGTHHGDAASLFEREFRTLAQLSHPNVIEVYDFGVEDDGPFYTMELLDGGDLRERLPLPWKDACKVAYEVCSALALIHSRRLVHRDVTPRNVRCTPDGRTKLIDFGAMVPMGSGSSLVGTPRFLAPEVVHRSFLDARTDLFSLGATLYFTLTHRTPYPARNLAEAVVAWRDKPAPPSTHVEGIPASLDALILSLVSIEPTSRPRTAFEVMHRLAAISGLEFSEPPVVSRSYLASPVLVGRDEAMGSIGKVMERALSGHGGGVLIEGAAGLGRSRMLDASALVAETLGWRVVRASSGALSGAFQAAERIGKQLAGDAPELALRAATAANVQDVLFKVDRTADDAPADRVKLRDLRTSATKPFELKRALGQWILRASDEEPLAVLVDDVHRADEPSLALVAALATEADGHRLVVLTSADTGAEPTDRVAFDALAKHSSKIELAPLAQNETQRLLESIFGDVPNVGIVAEGIHAIARGNPRGTMDLAQHLVDRRLVRYERGGWTLPPRLDASDLPRDAEEAIQERLSALGLLARWLAEAQALATYQTFSRNDYARIRPEKSAEEVDGAMTDLVAQQVVTSDGRTYSLAHRGYSAALLQPLSEADLAERHRALVSLYEGRLPLGVVRHALFAGLETRALDELAPILPGVPEAANLYELTDLGSLEVAATFERALTAAEHIGRSALEVNHLRRWLAALSVVSDDKYYFRAAPGWLARLKHDAGYDIWESLSDVSDVADRLSRTMQGAFGRYLATPEAERVYRPDEAVRGLVHFVGISLAVGSSRLDFSITRSLPPLLEPFAPIAPMVSIIFRNATAARESSCGALWEHAHDLWVDVYRELGTVEGVDPNIVGVFQRAVAYGIAVNEATMGLASAVEWADRLDADPVQRVNGLFIKRIVCLQHGDVERAESLRKQAEILTLQARSRQMFSHLHGVELVVCGLLRDVTGIKRCADRIHALAARSPGWAPYVDLADGLFRFACDDLEGACESFRRAALHTHPAVGEPVPYVWCHSVAGHVEALTRLGRLAEARRLGEEALAAANAMEIRLAAHGIARALAVAEAKCGEIDVATARLDALIQTQLKMGISGVNLGALHEARARIAIEANDRAAFDEYARLAAHEWGSDDTAPSASLERLMNDGTRVLAAVSGTWRPDDDASLEMATKSFTDTLEALSPHDDFDKSAEFALELLCTTARASAGHLYSLEEPGIRLAASLNAEAPEGLLGFLQRYVASGTDEGLETLRFAEDAPAGDETLMVTFTDASGVVYRPFLVNAVTNGHLRCAGAVALAVHDVGSELLETINAVGAWMMRARRQD